MLAYQAAPYRPVVASAPMARRPVQHHQLGSLSSMTLTNWALLVGGGVVGGVGINGLIEQSRERKINAVGVLLNLVLAGVGLTLFFQNGSKAISATA